MDILLSMHDRREREMQIARARVSHQRRSDEQGRLASLARRSSVNAAPREGVPAVAPTGVVKASSESGVELSDAQPSTPTRSRSRSRRRRAVSKGNSSGEAMSPWNGGDGVDGTDHLLHTPRSERGAITGGSSIQPVPAGLLVELDQRYWDRKKGAAIKAVTSVVRNLDTTQDAVVHDLLRWRDLSIREEEMAAVRARMKGGVAGTGIGRERGSRSSNSSAERGEKVVSMRRRSSDRLLRRASTMDVMVRAGAGHEPVGGASNGSSGRVSEVDDKQMQRAGRGKDREEDEADEEELEDVEILLQSLRPTEAVAAHVRSTASDALKEQYPPVALHKSGAARTAAESCGAELA